jgi:hypothetical protein
MRKLRTALKVIRDEGLVNLLQLLYRKALKWVYPDGVNVADEDWDNLIILDACRYDDFERLNTIPGTLESRISKGTDSPEFLTENFNGRNLNDTVYVTANPHFQKIDDGTFHAIIDEPLSQFDSDLQCVTPDVVTDITTRVQEEFPNKRLIIHYMQPHDPPLGPKAEEIRETINIAGPLADNNGTNSTRIMDAVSHGEVNVEDAREAYRENLQIVLDEVAELLEELDGKSVVTADHGEMFGERRYPFVGRQYEHGGPPTEELCKVPWFVVQNNKGRKDVHADPPQNRTSIESNEINKHLEALGYK